MEISEGGWGPLRWDDSEYFDVADDDDGEGEEEYLHVDDGVVEAVPGLSVESKQDVLRQVCLGIQLLHCEVFKEVDGGALVELLGWMF